jgi:hypothetical protein
VGSPSTPAAELRVPAVLALIQKIADLPQVEEIQIELRPKPGHPPCFGVRRGGRYSWSFGRNLLEAVQRADALVSGRAGIPAEVEAP